MEIELKGVLREITGSSRISMEFQQAVTVELLKRRIGIDAGIPVVACIDNRHMPADYCFADSDTVTLLPVVTGG